MPLEGLTSAIAPYSKEVTALTITLLGTLFTRLIQPKAKLFHSVRHRFHYILPEPLRDADGNVVRDTQSVVVESLSVSNTGKSTATAVELVFNWKPPYLNVWPLRHYKSEDHPDGRFSMILDSLSPGEVFGMELLAINVPLPKLCNVRSEQVESVEKTMIPQIVYPSWAKGAAAWLMFVGVVTTIYLLLALIEWGLR